MCIIDTVATVCRKTTSRSKLSKSRNWGDEQLKSMSHASLCVWSIISQLYPRRQMCVCLYTWGWIYSWWWWDALHWTLYEGHWFYPREKKLCQLRHSLHSTTTCGRLLNPCTSSEENSKESKETYLILPTRAACWHVNMHMEQNTSCVSFTFKAGRRCVGSVSSCTAKDCMCVLSI